MSWGQYLHSTNEKQKLGETKRPTYPRLLAHSTEGCYVYTHPLLPLHSSSPQVGSQTGRPVAWREDGATGPSSFRPVSTLGPLQSISVNMTARLLRAKHCVRNNEHRGAAGCFIRSVHVLVLILIIFQKFEASMQRRFQVQKGRHWRT